MNLSKEYRLRFAEALPRRNTVFEMTKLVNGHLV